jgi:hypothetical protein
MTPLFSGVKKGLIATGEGLYTAVLVTAKTVDSVEGRSYTHLLLQAIFKIVEVAKGSLTGPLALLSPIIDTTEAVFSACDIFGIGKYFFYKKPDQSEEPRIGKNPDGTLYRKNKNVKQTQAEFHIQENKLLKVTAKIGSVIKAIGAFALFLHTFEVVNLTALSSWLSSLGPVANVVSKIVAPVFVSAFLAVGGMITFGALTVDSVIYIAKAVHDPEKSLVKGLLDLASRVAAFAAFTLMLVGVTNLYVMIPVLAIGGIFGIASMVHSMHRDTYKAVAQKQNLQELTAREV